MSDSIDRQAAIDALADMHCKSDEDGYVWIIRSDAWARIDALPSAQGKPFNLPKIYIAEGYDTIEGEDGNVGFGVYVPDETKIYVAGDVEGEIRARALFHEVCHWVQAMCGRPFDEDEANEFSDIVYDALPSAQPEFEKKTGKAPTRAEMIDILTRRHDALVAVWMTADTPEQYKLAREIGAIEKMLRLYGAM